MRKQDKDWIDNATYEQLLAHWRFAPVGDRMFQDETGKYYVKVMEEKRRHVNAAAASKRVGWER